MLRGRTFCIAGARVVCPGERSEESTVFVQDGRIADVRPGGVGDWAGPVIQADGARLTPGLIDIHTHGIQQVRYESGGEDLALGAAKLGAFGCTCVFPTLIGKTEGAFLGLLEETCRALPTIQSVSMPGVHVEGPFLAYTGAGCATTPGDVGFLDDMLAAAGGRLAAMSISPEVRNIIPVIERLREASVAVFITHTGANLTDTQRAVDAGACHGTHFYDVFYAPPETDLGVRPVACTEALLADRRVTVDFIADGVHVEPTVIRLALYAKGWQNVILITDSSVGAGMPPGEYDTPWGFRIYAHPDKAARIIGAHPLAGALAGSALTMNRGMENLLSWFGDEFPSEHLWALGTCNPARRLGLPTKGVIRPGADADMVLWGRDRLVPQMTWVDGRLVYESEGV